MLTRYAVAVPAPSEMAAVVVCCAHVTSGAHEPKMFATVNWDASSAVRMVSNVLLPVLCVKVNTFDAGEMTLPSASVVLYSLKSAAATFMPSMVNRVGMSLEGSSTFVLIYVAFGSPPHARAKLNVSESVSTVQSRKTYPQL